jgi:hypothetical protein
MHKIETTADLKRAIQQMECLQTTDFISLKNQLTAACEKLKPINIIKSKFRKLVLAPAKNEVVNTVMGLATGFVSRKILIGKSSNPLVKIVGFVIERIIANKVTKNAAEIKAIGSIILQKIISQPNDPEKT